MRALRDVLVGLLVLVPVVAWADSDYATVRITMDRSVAQKCGEPLDSIKDDDVRDLKKKALKKGGNTILIAGTGYSSSHYGLIKLEDSAYMQGLVYNCPESVVLSEQGMSLQDSQLERRVRLIEDVLRAHPEFREAMTKGLLEVLREKK